MPSKPNCVRLCSTEFIFSHKDPRSNEQHLSGVILLNSPENPQWSCKEYFRLLKQYRGQRNTVALTQDRPICYFICADGAYDQLLKYYHAHHEELFELGVFSDAPAKAEGTTPTVFPPPFPLCDIIIGDMDSSERYQKALTLELSQSQDSSGSPQAAPLSSVQDPKLPFVVIGTWYDHVKSIPCEALGKVRAQALALAQGNRERRESGPADYKTFLFPITCQMTTDFTKSMLILQRLKRLYPYDFPEYYDDVSPPGRNPNSTWTSFVDVFDNADEDQEVVAEAQNDVALPAVLPMQALLQRFAEAIRGQIDSHEALAKAQQTPPNTPSDRAGNASEEGDTAESARLESQRCANLLNEIWERSSLSRCEGGDTQGMPSLHTCILPNVLILGSLGGRLDQEIASLSILFNFESKFHMVLTNKWNVMFPCASNGLTLWLRSTLDAGEAKRVEGDAGDHSSNAKEQQGLDKNETGPKESESQQLDREGDVCGIIPFGFVREMETTGFLYNIVKGRSEPPLCHYDGVTQTDQYEFDFSSFVSTSNKAVEPLMVVDMRILSQTHAGKHQPYGNPSTILTTNRLVGV